MSYPDQDRERLVGGLERAGRGPFQRDRARVLHSGAFRRLAGKTQVVEPVTASPAAPRTRLTHSLETAQIGRELGGSLGCDPDLVDAACLAHDLGHPPYGHNGETALDLVAQPCGGFEGNAQSLRVLTRLEVKIDRAGLDLTRATLDAATKYPWARRDDTVKYGVYADDLEAFSWVRRGAPGDRRCLEAQVMDWADDIAYSVHDYEDGVLAGLIDPGRTDWEQVVEAASAYSSEPGLLDVARSLGPRLPAVYDGGAATTAALKAAASDLIGRFCLTAERATRAAYGDGALTRYGADLVVPADVRAECALLKAVAAVYVMARPGVGAAQDRERERVTELVARLCEHPEALDPLAAAAWREGPDDAARLRAVVDQVASLTDASAVHLHGVLAG